MAGYGDQANAACRQGTRRSEGFRAKSRHERYSPSSRLGIQLFTRKKHPSEFSGRLQGAKCLQRVFSLKRGFQLRAPVTFGTRNPGTFLNHANLSFGPIFDVEVPEVHHHPFSDTGYRERQSDQNRW